MLCVCLPCEACYRPRMHGILQDYIPDYKYSQHCHIAYKVHILLYNVSATEVVSKGQVLPVVSGV